MIRMPPGAARARSLDVAGGCEPGYVRVGDACYRRAERAAGETFAHCPEPTDAMVAQGLRYFLETDPVSGVAYCRINKSAWSEIGEGVGHAADGLALAIVGVTAVAGLAIYAGYKLLR